MPQNEPFSVRPDLTAIAIGHRNEAHTLIADEVIPEMSQPVLTKSFQYTKYDEAEGYTVPDTKVGRLGEPNQVQQSGSLATETCQDFGLSSKIANDDITQGRTQNINVEGRRTQHLQNLILLDKERRVAQMVQDTANYLADHVTALVGTSKFSDYENSDPVRVLTEAMDGMLFRPNTVTFGQAVWSKLKLHPKVLKAIYPNGNGEGVATRQQIAELLEVKKIIVGEAWVNNAQKGQPLNRTRTWGNIVHLQFQDPAATNEEGVTWAARARYGEKVAGTMPAKVGLRGGIELIVGETVKEFICSKYCGYLFTGAI